MMPNPKKRLHQRFGLSDKQAQAVIEMQLRRLTGLAREKLEEELADLLEKIAYYKSILADEHKLLEIIKDEILQIKEKFADTRRSQISNYEDKLELEDLIEDEDVVITISHAATSNGCQVTPTRARNGAAAASLP